MRAVALGILVLMLWAGPAPAQRGPHERFEIAGTFGGSFPLGEFNNNANVGVQVGGHAGFYLTPRAVLGLGLDLYYNGGSDEYRETQMLPADADADFSAWHLALYYKQLIAFSNLSPYVRLQVGFYDIDANVDGQEVSAEDAEFALTGGLGLQVRGRGGLGGFAEFLFHRVIIDEENPETEGDLRSFLSLRGGVSLFFGRF